MALELITEQAALERTRLSLGLPSEADNTALVAASLRRAGAILAPCRAWELTRTVWASLKPMGKAAGIDADTVAAVLEELLTIGDFAEVSFREKEGGDDELLLCLTPPAFVQLATGQIVLLGGSDDGPAGLPDSVSERVIHRGPLRQIEPKADEDLTRILVDFGLLQITADAWLRLPRRETPAAHVRSIREKMPAAGTARSVEGLTVLMPGRFYSQRWREPVDETGMFVARRPQLYGSPVWCVVQLQEGQVTSLLDLHAPGSRLRPCDLAWQLQMAIDASAGSPQLYRCRAGGEGGREIIEVDAPLPSWAERRLRLTGGRSCSGRALLAFELPGNAASAECQFLQDYLWMREERIHGGGGKDERDDP